MTHNLHGNHIITKEMLNYYRNQHSEPFVGEQTIVFYDNDGNQCVQLIDVIEEVGDSYPLWILKGLARKVRK